MSFMNDSEILMNQTEDGKTLVDVRHEDETVWLTQAQMSELFQTSKQNISLHINNVFKEGELNDFSCQGILDNCSKKQAAAIISSVEF